MTPGPSIDGARSARTRCARPRSRATRRRYARAGAPRLRARVPAREAARARLEHLAHGRGDRHRAREPLAQDQAAQDRSRAWLNASARSGRSRARRRGRRDAGLPRALRVDAEVLENRSEGGENLRLRLRVPGWPGFLPGQFVMLSPGRAHVGRAHGSAAAAPDGGLPRPARRRRRRGRDPLPARRPRHAAARRDAARAARCAWSGPLGRPFAAPAPGERALLVAGGTGIASVYELAARSRGAGRAWRCCSARAAPPT